jgi:hypothetical protein
MKFEYGTRLSTEETGKPGDIDRWTAYLDARRTRLWAH